MKKLLIALYSILWFCTPAIASNTYYVREHGGTSSQCLGTTNDDYDGNGTGEPCAFSHPSYCLGAGYDRSTHSSGAMVGGDTCIVEASTSYAIGYGMPNTSGCSTSWTYECSLMPPPNGESGHETKLVGCSATGCTDPTTRPQFYLVGRLNQMMNIDNMAYVEISDLEITDHYGADAECSEGTPLQECGRTAFRASTGWHHITFKNLNIHGLTARGFLLGNNSYATISDVALTLDNVRIHANKSSGFDTDTCENNGLCGFNGNIVWNNVEITYNGCDEVYPLTGVGTDIVTGSCREGNNGGYGDGVGTTDTGGNWILTNNNISHNTSDGLDLLYLGRTDRHTYSPVGNLIIYGGRFEGNNGQQVKVPHGSKIYSAEIIGNCGYWLEDENNEVATDFSPCRAGGNAAVFSSRGSGTSYIYNSTLMGNGDVLIESEFPV